VSTAPPPTHDPSRDPAEHPAAGGPVSAHRVDVELWRVPSPIPHPVLTAAGRYDTYWHLVARVHLDGVTGWGYSGMATEAQLDAACASAAALAGGSPTVTLRSLLDTDGTAHDTGSRGATSALALAAWDALARSIGRSPASLWGAPGDGATTDPLACYASGFFLDASPAQLEAEAARYRAAGFRLVKMRTGLSLAEDVARFRIVQSVFPEPRAIAVDAFHSWDAPGARAFVDAVDGDLLWVEDATPYEQMVHLHPCAAPVASAESLETPDEVVALVRDARLDHALLDVQRLGGPRSWRRAAQAAAAAGARVGGHVYTAHSLHLLACVADPLPVEVFDWSDPLFVSPPAPGPDGTVRGHGPGFGLELDPGALRRWGTRVAP
jgi:L-alanine-DL-glutamate epimerase-like enolase superfamily enzyme